MATLLYVLRAGTPQPQVIFDVGKDGEPFLDDAIRRRVVDRLKRKLTAGEASDLASGALTLAGLSERYPPPGVRPVARQGRAS